MQKCKIAERLTELRRAKGVTQKDVASSLAVSNKTLSKWENGTSMPDVSILPSLAEYYEVTVDALLGLQDPPDSLEDTICAKIKGLDGKAAILRAFETTRALIPAVHTAITRTTEEECTNAVFPEANSRFCRTRISRPDFFSFTTSNTDANIAVTLLGNESNFSWMKDRRKQEAMVEIFELLSDKDCLSLLYFLHSAHCSESFTASYAAKGANIREEKGELLLEKLCRIGACRCTEAHLREGTLTVYECHGDGILLAMITLAYERALGKASYEHNYDGSCKMIGDVQ